MKTVPIEDGSSEPSGYRFHWKVEGERPLGKCLESVLHVKRNCFAVDRVNENRRRPNFIRNCRGATERVLQQGAPNAMTLVIPIDCHTTQDENRDDGRHVPLQCARNVGILDGASRQTVEADDST